MNTATYKHASGHTRDTSPGYLSHYSPLLHSCFLVTFPSFHFFPAWSFLPAACGLGHERQCSTPAGRSNAWKRVESRRLNQVSCRMLILQRSGIPGKPPNTPSWAVPSVLCPSCYHLFCLQWEDSIWHTVGSQEITAGWMTGGQRE